MNLSFIWYTLFLFSFLPEVFMIQVQERQLLDHRRTCWTKMARPTAVQAFKVCNFVLPFNYIRFWRSLWILMIFFIFFHPLEIFPVNTDCRWSESRTGLRFTKLFNRNFLICSFYEKTGESRFLALWYEALCIEIVSLIVTVSGLYNLKMIEITIVVASWYTVGIWIID